MCLLPDELGPDPEFALLAEMGNVRRRLGDHDADSIIDQTRARDGRRTAVGELLVGRECQDDVVARGGLSSGPPGGDLHQYRDSRFHVRSSETAQPPV